MFFSKWELGPDTEPNVLPIIRTSLASVPPIRRPFPHLFAQMPGLHLPTIAPSIKNNLGMNTMDLRLQSTNSALTPISSDMAQRLTKPVQQAEADGHGFSHALKNALHSVSAAQNHSSHLQQEVQMENPSVSLEQTMVAIQKAQIGFQATLHVRNRMVQAYTDIMNMQV